MSRITIRRNRRRAPSASRWSRVPGPRALANACGRVVRRSVPALVATVALAVVGAGVWLGYRFLTTSPRFAITAIDVRGNHRVATNDVLAALPVRVGDNVFTANVDELARELRSNPWIASVDVRRILPHTISIELHERTAAAVVELGGLYLVDADGHPFKRADADAEGLPSIDGLDRDAYRRDPAATAATIRAALATLATWRGEPSRPAISEIHIEPHGAITLRNPATAIRIGALTGELEARIRTFDVAWAELADDERARVRAVHLDARPDLVTVAFAQKD